VSVAKPDGSSVFRIIGKIFVLNVEVAEVSLALLHESMSFTLDLIAVMIESFDYCVDKLSVLNGHVGI
jgi:hypothetical protein